jgi:hypothetical protein
VCTLFTLAAVAKIGSYGVFLDVGCSDRRATFVTLNARATCTAAWRGINRMFDFKPSMKRLPQSVWKSLPAA